MRLTENSALKVFRRHLVTLSKSAGKKDATNDNLIKVRTYQNKLSADLILLFPAVKVIRLKPSLNVLSIFSIEMGFSCGFE